MGNGRNPFDCSSMSRASAKLALSINPPSRGDVGRWNARAWSLSTPLIWSKAVAVRAGAVAVGLSMLWKFLTMSTTAENEKSVSSWLEATDSARSLSKSLGAGGQA